jgi:hypothetical protein
MDSYYLKVGKASDLKNGEKRLYRYLEILPGFLAVGTLISLFFISWLIPIWASFFIIAFDLYWVIKTFYLSIHLRVNWRRMRHNIKLDWRERLSKLKYDHIWQMVILPFYTEGREVVFPSIESLIKADWNKDRMIVILASEERAGEDAQLIAKEAKEKYGNNFAHFFITTHPDDIEGEIKGKSANITWAAEEARKNILDTNKINYENVLVSPFDIDTQPYPQYFTCLTWHFLTCEKPFRSSFQPVPLYNNNIWDAPALSRVVAVSGTFWQMIQQERPERLATFSSQSVSFKTIYEAGYWQTNIVSEDSRIFWTSLLRFDGDYRVVPLSYPVSLDAPLAPKFLETAKNVYKQQRRWGWGVENVPYMLFGFWKNKKISRRKKLHYSFMQLEGFWSLSTNPLIIFLMGWLPLMLGGRDYNESLLSYNLPRATRNLMIVAMFGLIMSAIITISFLPPRPAHRKKHRYFFMVLQWVLIPFTIPLFGALPGLDAQIRLMLGRYMGFWVTPKHRK